MQSKLILYVTALLGALLIGVGVYLTFQSKNRPVFESIYNHPSSINGTTITVRADLVWNDTGINIKQGQKITIQASGQINVGSPGNAADRWVGPDGWGNQPSHSWICGNQPCRYVNVSNSLGSLIGKIGKKGKPFEIGNYTSLTASDSGTLFLAVDDSFSDETGRLLPEAELQRQIYYNNRGSFTAIVQVEEEQKTFNVPLDVPWTPTGITISAGQTLTAKATGKGVWKNISQSSPNSYPKSFEECTPDGTPPVDDKDYYANIISYAAADAYKGALLAKVGESGKPFKLGTDFKGVIQSSGTLYLGINDMRPEVDPNAFKDNSGSYTVQITVR